MDYTFFSKPSLTFTARRRVRRGVSTSGVPGVGEEIPASGAEWVVSSMRAAVQNGSRLGITMSKSEKPEMICVLSRRNYPSRYLVKERAETPSLSLEGNSSGSLQIHKQLAH